MRVRVAESGCLYWRAGQLIWDDAVRHQQLALTPRSERLLRAFATWRDLSDVDRLGDDQARAVAQRLLERGVLIAEGSPQHAEEERRMHRWRAWGPAARQFHFSSRAPAGTAVLSTEDIDRRLRAKAARQPAPEPVKSYPGRDLVPLPGGAEATGGWPYPGLLECLYRRRTTRAFGTAPVTIEELARVLRMVGGIIRRYDDPETGTELLRTSPFPGARHAIELYVCAMRVDGLAPGLYHFAAQQDGLAPLRVPCPDAGIQAAVGNQPWIATGAALIFYTAVLERLQWKYEMPRSYRDLMIGFGHYSQTAYLTATALGLGVGLATVVCDEAIEELLGCDGSDEIVLGTTVLGRPVS